MSTTENLERLVKFFSLLNELVKFAAMGVLALLAIGAMAAPTWVKGKLADIGIEIKEISAGPLKLVAKETVKAGANTLQIAEALTQAELRLSELATTAQQQSSNAGYALAVDDTLRTIHSARAALDEQSSSLKSTGKVAGVAANPPSKGWVYVGLFGEDGKPRLPSNRFEAKNGVRLVGNTLSELVLRFDAPVVSDGDDCTKTDVADFVPPSPSALERQIAVLRASSEPLKVLTTKACKAAGGNQVVYAQIEVPSNRVRFATLASVPQ